MRISKAAAEQLVQDADTGRLAETGSDVEFIITLKIGIRNDAEKLPAEVLPILPCLLCRDLLQHIFQRLDIFRDTVCGRQRFPDN